MAAPDPEVRELTLESLKLVVQAEAVLVDLQAHQARVAEFLTRASRYVGDEESGDGHDGAPAE